MNSLVLLKYRIQRDDSIYSLKVFFQSSAYWRKSYLLFEDEEFKRFLAVVVGQRHREMKLSVCCVVIIANRKVDNTALGGISHRQYLECSWCTSALLLLFPAVTIVESEGRFALHAMSFSNRSTWRLTGPIYVWVLRARTHTKAKRFRTVIMLNYCYSRSSARLVTTVTWSVTHVLFLKLYTICIGDLSKR